MYAISLKKIKDLPTLLEDIRDFYNVITSDSVIDCLLPKGVDHVIDLKLGECPLFRPLYNLLVKELAAL